MRRIGISLILVLVAATAAAAEPRARGVRAPARAPAPVEDDGYVVRTITAPDGEKIPVMNIPGSVTVVTRRMMDDQQATSISDALRNAAGVTVRGR
jgi:outer membrane receptor for ferric coprogen and ferric-rhodotorulic acid